LRAVAASAFAAGGVALAAAALGPGAATCAPLGALALGPWARRYRHSPPLAGAVAALVALAWPTGAGPAARAAVAVLLIAFAPLAALVARLERRPTHDALDHVLLAAGAWLVLAAGTGAALAPPGPARPAPLLCAVAGLAGAAAAAAALALAHRRLRWLGRVYDGLEARWQVVPTHAAYGAAAAPPLFLSSEETDGLLRCERGAASACSYRAAPPAVISALVPFEAGRALDLARRRRAWTASVFAAQLALVALLWAPLVS
jgi:hypothetical protein